jgi:hypothetical protein
MQQGRVTYVSSTVLLQDKWESVIMSAKNCNIAMLEDRAKRASVRDMIISTGATIGCLQETKINNWTHNFLVEAVGVDMASNVATLPSVPVCGGILIAPSEHFSSEITNLRPHVLPIWLMLGDFNLIFSAQEKNNSRLNLPMMNRFRVTVDNTQLARIELRGKMYTRCNDQHSPTMTKKMIIYIFASADWLEIFPRSKVLVSC